MTSFEDRENAFEGKFAHEEKMDFAVEARCSKLFGLWVAFWKLLPGEGPPFQSGRHDKTCQGENGLC